MENNSFLIVITFCITFQYISIVNALIIGTKMISLFLVDSPNLLYIYYNSRLHLCSSEALSSKNPSHSSILQQDLNLEHQPERESRLLLPEGVTKNKKSPEFYYNC